MHRVDQWSLGQKVHYHHPVLGELTAHIHDDRPHAPCIWLGKVRHPAQRQDTGLVLSGYPGAPLRSQLTSVQRILDGLGDTEYHLRRRINRFPDRFPGVVTASWTPELVLVSTHDADTATFALTFEWGCAPQLRAISVQWAGGELYDLKVY